MAVKILHAADFHMDSPFVSLPEEKAAERRREQRLLLERIADIAKKEKVQIVLLPGDLLDSATSYWETQESLLKVLSEIKAEIFIAPGNHDYYSAKSPYASMEFPENVHIFKTPVIKCVELPTLGCRVWGAGFTSSRCDSIIEGFSASSNLIDIMVLHGEINGDMYGPITEEDIAASGMDYIALGHVHTFSGIKKAGNTYYAYPGCPEGRGFDETGPHGVIVGTIGKGKCDLHFQEVPGRQYLITDVDVTGSDDVYETVKRACEPGRENDIVRIVLRGEYTGGIDTQMLAESLKDRFYHVVVKNATRPERGMWDGADEDSLMGLFLTRMREKYDSAFDDAEREKIILAVRYGLAALEGREGLKQ